MCKELDGLRETFTDSNAQNIALFNKILGFQFEMHHITKGKVPDQMKVIHGLCFANIEYSIHAIKQLERGTFFVFHNTIRPIYESIPKMFYMLRYPKDVMPLMIKEYFDLWRIHQDSNNIESIVDKFFNKLKVVDDEKIFTKISYENLKKITTDRKRFTPVWFRRQIYTPKSKSKRDQTYGMLSISAHANFVRIYNLFSPKPQEMLKMLTELSLLNLLLNANAIAQTLANIGEFDDTKKFIMETYDKLDGFLVGSALYPDQTTYTSKLKIKLPSK